MPRIIRTSHALFTPPAAGVAFILSYYDICKVTGVSALGGTAVAAFTNPTEPIFLFLQAPTATKLVAWIDSGFAPTYNTGFYYSTDGGATWQFAWYPGASPTYPTGYWQMLRKDYTDPNLVWSAVLKGSSVYCWATADAGVNWTETALGALGGKTYGASFAAPRHDGDSAFCGWTTYSADRNYVSIVDKDGNILDSYNYAGTGGHYDLHRGCTRFGDDNVLYYITQDGFLYSLAWDTKTLTRLTDVPQLGYPKDLVSTYNGTLLLVNSWNDDYFEVYRSTDGANWSLVDLSGIAPSRVSLDLWDHVCTQAGGDLFIPVWDTGGGPFGGFFSDDEGASWSWVDPFWSFVNSDDIYDSCGV